MPPILVPFQISGDRVLALLAHTMGNLERAIEHFDDALAFCRKAGYRPELAWTCCDYADTLLQRNEPGDEVCNYLLSMGSLCAEMDLRNSVHSTLTSLWGATRLVSTAN